MPAPGPQMFTIRTLYRTSSLMPQLIGPAAGPRPQGSGKGQQWTVKVPPKRVRAGTLAARTNGVPRNAATQFMNVVVAVLLGIESVCRSLDRNGIFLHSSLDPDAAPRARPPQVC